MHRALRHTFIFLENIKVFFAAWECVKTKPRPYEPKDSIVHVLTHPPVCKCVRTHRATHTVASGHTYIRIELHVRTHEPARIYVIVSGSVITDSLSMGDKGRNNKSPSNMQFDGLLSLISSLLDYQDSNLDKQNQNLLCYHYTIVQSLCAFLGKRCKDTFFYLYSPNIFALFFATICKCLSL